MRRQNLFHEFLGRNPVILHKELTHLSPRQPLFIDILSLRGYNPSMTAMGCETFSLADFTLKQTTFEPYHEDTQFSASDENPLVAYKVRVNFEGNLPLPESECKWTHVGFCYDRPHVEWIHGYFTGNFNDDGAPIVTVEWAAAGPYSSTVYDLWRNGKYELYDITGTSITFAIGGHPDSTDVTHEFGVRAVNLPDGCLSDLVTCTVTVPGDVTTCPPQPGDILLMSSIVGPVYDENNELVGIKVQLVWSGETGSFIKIHRSFEECDQESPVIDTVSATQSCYYDILQSGQIAYYYVESGRNNCPKVGESECLTVSVLPQTGLNEGTVYFYVKDHLGNTRLVLDGEGNIQSRMSYEPYGVELYPLAANTMNEKYKFTNQERDYTTGLDYFHARYYGSAMGRFMRPDPVSGNPANPESWNLYSYVRSNPINRTDPTGLWGLSSTQETGKKGKIKVSYTVTKSKDGDDVASLVKQLGFKGKDAEKLAKAITEKFGANAANMQLSQLGGIVGRTFQAMESGASYQAQSEAKNKGNPEYVDCSMTAARIASPSTNVIPGQWDIHRTNNLIESLNLSSVSSGDERTGDIIRWGVGGKTHYANVIFTDDEGKIRVFSKEGGTGPFSSDRNLTDPFFNTNYGKITGEFRPED
ncbi:MAG TPA: RHS repeat-associated core domain-containing protein [Acidobacteriota bacterium]|nr:RHS repeat-associated core domain-containing protein [Acidobacteriota bacterium]